VAVFDQILDGETWTGKWAMKLWSIGVMAPEGNALVLHHSIIPVISRGQSL
jgi:hypothetical protein